MGRVCRGVLGLIEMRADRRCCFTCCLFCGAVTAATKRHPDQVIGTRDEFFSAKRPSISQTEFRIPRSWKGSVRREGSIFFPFLSRCFFRLIKALIALGAVLPDEFKYFLHQKRVREYFTRGCFLVNPLSEFRTQARSSLSFSGLEHSCLASGGGGLARDLVSTRARKGKGFLRCLFVSWVTGESEKSADRQGQIIFFSLGREMIAHREICRKL